MRRFLFAVPFLLGAIAVVWIAATFLSNPVALTVTLSLTLTLRRRGTRTLTLTPTLTLTLRRRGTDGVTDLEGEAGQ